MPKKPTYEELEQRLRALHDISSLTGADLKTVSDHVLKTIVAMTGSGYGFYGFVNEDESAMTIHSWSGEAMTDCVMVEKPFYFPVSEAGLWGEAIRKRRPIIYNDYHADHSGKKGLPEGHVRLTRLLVVPFMYRSRITSVAAVANRAIGYDENDVTQIVSFLTSIQANVESKCSETALRESEMLLRQVIDTSPDCIFVKNRDGRYVLVNKTIAGLYHMDADEMLGRTDYELAGKGSLRPEEAESFLSDDREVIDGNMTKRITEEPMTLADGTQRWFRTVKTPLPLVFRPDCMLGIATDITEYKQSEAERARLMSAVEQASEMFVITDINGIIQYVNPAFEQTTGYSRQEAVGQNPRILKSGEHDEGFYRHLWETILSGSAWKGRMTNQRKDGSLYIEDAAISPVFDAAGRIVNLVAVKHDITDEIRTKESLRQAQRMEAIGTLAGGIAHDFNNILFPIIGHTEMLLDQSPEGSDSRSSLHEILSASMRAKELVQQILTFSSQLEKEPRPVKMQFIVREVLQLVKASIPSTITIRQHIDQKCGMVLADPTNIHQIAMNLITNAYHAMEAADDGTLTIQLSQVNLSADDVRPFDLNPGTYVCFSVSDTGHGIENTVLNRIFEPYFTTKPEGKGTGLGLSVVHGIVKSYNGDIRVYSEPGKGSTFHVYLPAIDAQQEKEIIRGHLPVQGGSEHLLLVDDEAPILKMEKRMLENLGYRITMRTSGEEALQSFRLSPDQFDLVITDMTMPRMTGEKLAMEIKNIRKEIPVIVCTGFSEKMSPEKARELGIEGFLPKPIVKSELAKTIRVALDRRKKG